MDLVLKFNEVFFRNSTPNVITRIKLMLTMKLSLAVCMTTRPKRSMKTFLTNLGTLSAYLPRPCMFRIITVRTVQRDMKMITAMKNWPVYREKTNE